VGFFFFKSEFVSCNAYNVIQGRHVGLRIMLRRVGVSVMS
jgi:hypothetical protein